MAFFNGFIQWILQPGPEYEIAKERLFSVTIYIFTGSNSFVYYEIALPKCKVWLIEYTMHLSLQKTLT